MDYTWCWARLWIWLSNCRVVWLDGSGCVGELCTMPMYDEERLIPRGKLVDIPVRPVAAE